MKYTIFAGDCALSSLWKTVRMSGVPATSLLGSVPLCPKVAPTGPLSAAIVMHRPSSSPTESHGWRRTRESPWGVVRLLPKRRPGAPSKHSFPFDRSGRLARDVVHDPVHARHLARNARRDALEQVVVEPRPVRS